MEDTATGLCAAGDEDTAVTAAVGSIAVEVNNTAAAEEDTAAVESVVLAAVADAVAGKSVPCWRPGIGGCRGSWSWPGSPPLWGSRRGQCCCGCGH